MRKTVFVVGAGASREFGLPVGSELAQTISTVASSIKYDGFGIQTGGDRKIGQALKILNQEFPETNLLNELEKISSGVLLSKSIDNYLHAHNGNEPRVKLGKLLIANSLLEAEGSSALHFDPGNIFEKFDFTKVSNTWLLVLFQTLATAGTYSDLAEKLEQITFVSFNYDRIIKRFFFLAVQTLFDMSENDAGDFCEEYVEVYYPYGSLGLLRPKISGSGFGEIANVSELLPQAEHIKVFTEGANRATQSIVQEKLLTSSAVFFLGFSFLKLNMDYLKPETPSPFLILGTNHGISDYNSGIAANRIAEWVEQGAVLRSGFNLEDSFCADLISDYSGYFE